MYIDSDGEHLMNLNTDYYDFDRYIDIQPYRFNTIYINQNKYVNASSMYVYDKEKYFISTQGPKQETIEDFWTMIDEYNVKVIAMICKEMEDGVEKCSNYWSEENEMTLYKLTIEKETIEDQYVIRKIKLYNKSTKKEKIVRQIHFNGWPDHGVPDVSDGKVFDSFNEMIELVDKQIDENVKEIQFSIFNLVRKLKEMRLYSVQTQPQYNFIHEYVRYFLTNNNI